MIKQRGLIYLEQKKQEKMILQRCLSSYLKQKHKNIMESSGQLSMLEPRAETKEKKAFLGQLAVVRHQFSPLSVHIYMLRQEDLSFPGKLLVSVL